jgi:hypothetical protein
MNEAAYRFGVNLINRGNWKAWVASSETVRRVI